VVTETDEQAAPSVPAELRRRLAGAPRDHGRANATVFQRWAADLLAEMAARCAFQEGAAREIVRAVFGIRRQGAVRVRLETSTTPALASAPRVRVGKGHYQVGASGAELRDARGAATALAAAGGLSAL